MSRPLDYEARGKAHRASKVSALLAVLIKPLVPRWVGTIIALATIALLVFTLTRQD